MSGLCFCILKPVEGNSELRSFLLMGPADLHNELKRHKELCESSSRCVSKFIRKCSLMICLAVNTRLYYFLNRLRNGVNRLSSESKHFFFFFFFLTASKVNCEVNATRVHEKWLQGKWPEIECI